MVGAVVLAAGRSRRMGRCKLTLPWGDDTVIGAVVSALERGGARPIVVVTGAWAAEVRRALAGRNVRWAHNPHDAEDAMLRSAQYGLQALPPETEAALLALGDMPAVPVGVIAALVDGFAARRPALLVPSFRRRRGHPWLLARALWPALLALRPPATLRDFLHTHADAIAYLEVDTPAVLQDLDTPADYERLRGVGEQKQTPHP